MVSRHRSGTISALSVSDGGAHALQLRVAIWWPQGTAIAGPFPVRLPVRGTLTLKAA